MCLLRGLRAWFVIFDTCTHTHVRARASAVGECWLVV